MILGIISSYLLPELFMNKISKYLYKTKKNDKKEGSQSTFYQA